MADKDSTITRPDPDELLKKISDPASEGSGTDQSQSRQGKLKIFLGYSAGVGKTYRMLQQSGILKKKGIDVLVGIVETHGRQETEALLSGLEIFPLKEIDHKGLKLKEPDIDGILKRKPGLVLIDELAHSNIGSRHEKRWQDIEELLNSGINVFTTLNIQHVNSLNNIIQSITGIKVTEIIPDKILDSADEIEIIDLPPDDLLTRLKEGKVYVPDRTATALMNFFKKGNLLALRELVLDTAAKHVDRNVLSFMEKNAIKGPWPLGWKILASFSSSPTSENVLRYAHRLAENFGTGWFAVNVDSVRLAGRTDDSLNRNIRLAEELGASVVSISSDDVSGEIIDFAARNNITMIVIGASHPGGIVNIFRETVAEQLARRSKDISVLIVGHGNIRTQPRKNIVHRTKRNWQNTLIALSGVAVTTLLGWLIRKWVDPVNIAMLYLIPSFVASIFWGNRIGLFTSILGILAFDFFFIPPLLTFRVSDIRYLPVFLVFILVTLIVGFLTRLVRSQLERLRDREHLVSLLLSFSREILSVSGKSSIIQKATQNISSLIQSETVIMLPENNGMLKVSARSEETSVMTENEIAVAQWAYKNGTEAGHATGTLSSVRWHFQPIKTSKEILGVAGIVLTGDALESQNEKLKMLQSFINILAVTLSKE